MVSASVAGIAACQWGWSDASFERLANLAALAALSAPAGSDIRRPNPTRNLEFARYTEESLVGSIHGTATAVAGWVSAIQASRYGEAAVSEVTAPYC